MAEVKKEEKRVLAIVELARREAQAQVIQRYEGRYEQLIINPEQIQHIAETFATMAKTYGGFIQAAAEDAKRRVRAQQGIAQSLSTMCSTLSLTKEVSFMIQTPIVPEFPVLQPYKGSLIPDGEIIEFPALTPIPEKAVISLPLPKQKYLVPLSAVTIRNNGFMIEGKPIKGMTINSNHGKVFSLLVAPEASDMVPDNVIEKMLHIEPGDYQALCYVIRDLKRVLAGNKLELDMERFRSVKGYKTKALVQRIRKPKKLKKIGTSN